MISPEDGTVTEMNTAIIKGITEPNAHVVITIRSDPTTCTTDADTTGKYRCTFATVISTGTHSLIVNSFFTGGAVTSSPNIVLGINVGLSQTGDPAWLSLLALPALIGGTLIKRRIKLL